MTCYIVGTTCWRNLPSERTCTRLVCVVRCQLRWNEGRGKVTLPEFCKPRMTTSISLLRNNERNHVQSEPKSIGHKRRGGGEKQSAAFASFL